MPTELIVGLSITAVYVIGFLLTLGFFHDADEAPAFALTWPVLVFLVLPGALIIGAGAWIREKLDGR